MDWLIPDEPLAQAANQAPSSPITGSVLKVCVLSSTDTYPWYSFDLKGTSFLAKPAQPNLQSSAPVQSLAQDASFTATDGYTYTFRNSDLTYMSSAAPGVWQPIGSRWGIESSTIQQTGVVDAAWWRDKALYLASGSALLAYPTGTQYAALGEATLPDATRKDVPPGTGQGPPGSPKATVRIGMESMRAATRPARPLRSAATATASTRCAAHSPLALATPPPTTS
jgi:hypothetical protein